MTKYIGEFAKGKELQKQADRRMLGVGIILVCVLFISFIN